jgi:hypothetical protein
MALGLVFMPFAAAGERCLAIDGDTLVCNHRKVRLTNVYAPEMNEAGGATAKRRLQSVIGAGEVTLKPFGQDRYGRTLAEVYVGGRRIQQEDIGPRAGRGSAWSSERHYYIRSLPAPKKPRVHRKPAPQQRKPLT